jgi:hypothetical protein
MMKKTLEDFPLDKVNSVQWSSGLAFGKLIIFAAGNKAEIGNMSKKDGKDLADLVRDRITSGGKASDESASTRIVEVPTANVSASVADELKKLADLRDAGVLSDGEFQEQKARLLR